jgi:preprotein translocase subunit SecB
LPAIHLAEINFEAFYSQKMAAMQQQSANAATAAPASGNGAASG